MSGRSILFAVVLSVLSGCGGPEFRLSSGNGWTMTNDAEPIKPTTTPRAQGVPDGGDQAVAYLDSAPLESSSAHAPLGTDAGVLGVPADASIAIDGGPGNVSNPIDAAPEAAPLPIVDASEACAPAPVVGGYSDIGAKNPAAGRSIISSFPGECACDWTCACLMKSSVCLSLGSPMSCEWMPPGGLYVAVVNCG
jgi:hypothetical protein